MNWDIYKQLADRWYEGYKHKLYIQQQKERDHGEDLRD